MMAAAAAAAPLLWRGMLTNPVFQGVFGQVQVMDGFVHRYQNTVSGIWTVRSLSSNEH